MGSFKVPECALVRLPKLVDLARNETDGLMRRISEPAVSHIREDMVRVGIVKGKFGRPTINISCDMSDEVYRSLFHPVLPGDLQIINEETNFLDLPRIPVLFPTIELQPHLNFTDGRHRVIACSKVATNEEMSNHFVLCFITNTKDSLRMKQDSFRKSEVRPLVFDSIHDVLVCLPQWESGNTSKIREVICNTLKICDRKQAYTIELLHCHIFRESRGLLDTHRDSNLFSKENVFKRCSTPFISFIKETGKGQYGGYRYEFRSLFKSESGLKAREMVQSSVILAMIYFAKCAPSVATIKILANAPKLVMTQMKKYTCLSETDLVKFFVDLVRELFLYFKMEAVDNARLKRNLELVSREVIVEGLGFDMASLQDCFNENTISNTPERPQLPDWDVDIEESKSVGNNADSGAPSRDSENKVSARAMTRKRSHLKRNANLVGDRMDKNKKQRCSKLHSGKKSTRAVVSVMPSPRALCAAKCLDFSEEILKDVSFFPLKCREKRYVIDGLRKRESPSNAILFIDATSPTGKLEEAVIALSRCNVEVKKILFWSTEAIMENSIQVPGFSLRLKSQLVVTASQGDGSLGRSYYAQLLLPPGDSYKGPASTKNVFNPGVSEAEIFEWFFSTTFSGTTEPCDLQCRSWVDFTTHSQVVVLEYLMEHNFGVAYYKILKDCVDQEMKNLDCLLALRRKVTTLCSCGGHSILSASNQAILNDLGDKTYGDTGESDGEYPFIMYGHRDDKMPHGNVMEHPSLLLKKNMIGDTPTLARDTKLLCESRRDENGILLQRGAFVSGETFENLKSKNGSVELILPSNILVDRHTKREKYEFCISEFEMRDWFVSGMTDQIFSVIFPDSSVASLLNEGTEHSEVSFTPRHRSVQYLDILFREGLQAAKCPELCLIYCKLNSSALTRAESRGLQCKNCKAVELLTYYGSDFDSVSRETMSKKVRFSPSTKGFCTFACVEQPKKQNERPRAKELLSTTEFDQYYYPPEQKQCYVKEKSDKGKPRIRQSLKKRRRTKNRFVIKDDGNFKRSRTSLAPDFVDLIMSTRDQTENLPSRNGHLVQTAETELEVEQIGRHSKTKNDERKSGKWTKRNVTVLGGKSRVRQKKSDETVLERRSHLRIIPLAESNIRAGNLNSVPIRAEPGIEYNIFYLLSAYGDDISTLNTVNIDTMKTTSRKLIPWSCSRAWFLCSVQKNGFPWSIRRKEDASEILNSSCVTAYMSDYILKQKLLDLTMARDFPGFVEKEYSAYREQKFRTLHFVGHFSMKKYMKIHKERHTSGRLPYQSLRWENNSCALDAFLFVLPQICYSVISKGMYRSKMAGSDPCFHSPAACIFAALEAVQSEEMELSLASNWTRHLFMDLIQYVRPEHNMNDAVASWSSFAKPQGYLDLSSVLSYIPYLLGEDSPAFRNLQIPRLLEVPMHFTRATFEKSRHGENFKTLGAFLLESIVLAAQTANQQISESIYLFALTFEEGNPSSSTFRRWLQKMFLTSWSYDSKRKESNLSINSETEVSNKEKTWRFETLGLIGCSSTSKNHFVSLFSSSTSQDSVWFYDGMKENGQAKCLSKRAVMSLSEPQIRMNGLFVLSSLNLLV